MTTLSLRTLAIQFWCTEWTIQSWLETLNLWLNQDMDTVSIELEKHRDKIQAHPFIKWVGWKRQLIKQFESKKLIPTEFNNYFEPFLWGWAVFFNIQKKKSYLSDMNGELINTYQVIKNHPKALITFLKKINHCQETYTDIRGWDRQEAWQKKYTKIARAGRFIYLNRTCFNWLHRVNSRGEFNVPMGKYKNPDFIQEMNIKNTSLLLNKTEAEIRTEGFEHVLDKAKSWDFVYFDPPYDALTETANFTSYNKVGFGRDMQIKLAEVFRKLDTIGCKVMLSNHDTPLIRELFDGFRIEIVKARRNVNSKAGGRGEVDEVVVINY